MHFLLRLRISARLALSFAGVIAVFLMVVAVAFYTSFKTREAENWNVHTYQVLGQADELLKSMINMETGARGFLLAGEDKFLEPWTNGLSAFDKAWSESKRLTADNPEQQRRLEDIRARHLEFKGVVESMIAARREVSAGRQTMTQFVAQFALARDKAAMDAFRGLHQKFDAAERDLLVVRAARAEDLRTFDHSVLIGGSLAALVIGVLFAGLLTRSITGPVHRAVEVAERVAAGDLTQNVQAQGQDEIARLLQAMQTMQDRLSGVVVDIQRGADSVSTASSEISQGNTDLSSRTEEQASALEQTSASMKELATTVKRNSEDAEHGNQLAVQASTVATRGGEVVGQVVQTMKGINDSSRKIADIISVIDGIAFQTNILALNAAVEAARAGEQGRGFAVVASEVRSLAQRSADAAKEIKALITDSVGRVEAGSALVDEAGSTMTEVVHAIREVSQIMAGISSASRQQSAGVDQVGEAVRQMDQTTQQNAALVEQSAAAAESLRAQARQLVDAVAIFRMA